jgi:competence protein ComEA
MRTLLIFLAMLLGSTLCFAQVNINTARERELETLPSIGPVKSKAIVDFRTKHGPFGALDHIKKVDGVGDATFEAIKGHITLVGPAKTPQDDPPAPEPEQRVEEVSEYAIRCDLTAQRLIVSKPFFLPRDQPFTPSASSGWQTVFDPDLMVVNAGTEEAPRRVGIRKKVHWCKLKKGNYRIEIEPSFDNPNPFGYCGAAPTSIVLSIQRNGKPLVTRLGYEGCDMTSALKRIVVKDSEQVVESLAYRNDDDGERWIERRFPFFKHLNDWRTRQEELFGKKPSS